LPVALPLGSETTFGVVLLLNKIKLSLSLLSKATGEATRRSANCSRLILLKQWAIFITSIK
jgi:hypothetical protein